MFKHQRIEAEIRQLALTLPIGARLPAERSMAVSYQCNFLTVRRALKQLVDDGTVVRRIGSGTFVARHIRKEESGERRIGVLVYQIGNPYSYRVMEALARAALEQRVQLRSSWVRDYRYDGLRQAGKMAEEGCRALLLPWFSHDRIDEVRSFVRECPLPVSLPMLIPGLEKNCFERKDIFGGNLQVATEAICDYFHAMGCRRIALLGPDTETDVVLQKVLSTYACYMSRENLPNLCGLVRPGATAMDQLAERWKGHRGDLAVISYDDEHALRFMTAMHKIGLGAPGDFQIVGHNDTEASEYSDPPLSTIRQNFDYIGGWLLRNALGLAKGVPDQSTEPPRPRMLIRQTCGGLGRMDDAFRQRLSKLEIIQPRDQPSATPVPAP